MTGEILIELGRVCQKNILVTLIDTHSLGVSAFVLKIEMDKSWSASKFFRSEESSASGSARTSRAQSNNSLCSQDDELPKSPNINDFQILRKLGHGGFGRVFLAQHSPNGTPNGRYLALKVV